MGDDAAAHQLGPFIRLPPGQLAQRSSHGGRLAAQHPVRQIGRQAALHIGKRQVQAMACRLAIAHPVEQLAHGVGTVLLMQQQVVYAGVTQLVVMVQVFAALEPVGWRQAGQQVARVGNLALHIRLPVIDQAQQSLHLITPVRPVLA
ncbi:MAG: hypothetical protein JWP47_1115 [Polaromonas sp.]|nr:hypothetical protein [Polaromonas sp.]